MSDNSSGDAEKPMEQPDNDLSEAMENHLMSNTNQNGNSSADENSKEQRNEDLSTTMENPSVTADDSDKTSPPKNLSDMPIGLYQTFIEPSNGRTVVTVNSVDSARDNFQLKLRAFYLLKPEAVKEYIRSLACNAAFKPCDAYSVYKVFRSHCGENVMDYREFDFWFYRFLSGNFDEDSRYDEESSLHLFNLPEDLLPAIFSHLNLRERLILRKVSKSLRKFIDLQKPYCTRLQINFFEEDIRCYYNKQSVIYVTPKSDKIERWMKKEKNDGTTILIIRDDYEKIALEDMLSTLKNPRLQLDTLSLKTFNEDYEPKKYHAPSHKIVKMLKQMNHQISAKEYGIQLTRPSKELLILPFLKPGVLEKIVVNKDNFRDEARISETYGRISHFEQWKQAKELQLVDVLENFPLECATHFKRFQINETFLTIPTVTRIRDFLSHLDDFEYCTLTSSTNVRNFSTVTGTPAPANERTDYVNHYSIPSSNDYLEFLFFEKSIEVRRKKR